MTWGKHKCMDCDRTFYCNGNYHNKYGEIEHCDPYMEECVCHCGCCWKNQSNSYCETRFKLKKVKRFGKLIGKMELH